MKFVEDLKVLEFTKEKVTTDLLAQIEKKDVEEVSQENLHSLWRLKEDYARLRREMKEELTKEVEFFYKKFDTQVGELDLSPNEQIRVKDYFKAFIETFSFAFEASQAIESGKFELNIGCLLSAFASFGGSGLSSAIVSLDKFLSTQEMKTNANKILELFSDSTYLNAMIGKIAEKIVLDQKKREYILSVTDKELDKKCKNLLKKIKQFCEQIVEHSDVDFYKILYKTAGARLGLMDANDLIREYCEGKISMDRVQEEFVEQTMNRQRGTNDIEEATPPTTATPVLEKMKRKTKESGKGKYCSIF